MIDSFSNSLIPALPKAPELEAVVLGCMLMAKDQPEVVAQIITQLEPSDFYDAANQLIFDAARTLFSQGQAIDPPHLLNTMAGLTGGLEFDENHLHNLILRFSGFASLDSDMTTLRQLRVNRQLLEGTIAMAADPDRTHSPQLLESVQTLLLKLSKHQTAQSESLIGDLLPQLWKDLEERAERGGGLRGLSTGYSRLDNLLGGLEPTRLAILCAQTGIGKTSFATSVALSACITSGQPVLYASMEMGKLELAERIACQAGQLDASQCKRATFDADFFTRLAVTTEKLGNVPLILDDDPQTLASLRAKALRIKAQHGTLGLLVVDYLGLIRHDDKKASRYEAVSALVRGLKDIALELKIPVLCLAQPNRQVNARGDNLRLSDLKDSGEIEQAADIVMFLNRKPDTSLTTLEVAKQRNGPLGQIQYRFRPEWTKYEELAV